MVSGCSAERITCPLSVMITERVRRRPWSVLLFDELEKAHPEVCDLLLQLMDEGRLTDAQGRRADFRNAIIVMTGNVGARAVAGRAPLGFGDAPEGAARGVGRGGGVRG